MAMALALPVSTFLPPNPTTKTISFPKRKLSPFTTISCSKINHHKIIRCPPLDRRATKHNKLRFARKLTTLLLSKPRHFLPLRVLSRCRRYLALPPSRSPLAMILRYPSLFTLSHVPSFPSPSLSALAVSLSPAAARLAGDEALLRSHLAASLASKLQKLLLLASPHRRLLLSKLAHLAPDLGLPPSFRSRLCNSHPSLFRTVNTSFGRALELVSYDPSLALPLPPLRLQTDERSAPIIDRPPKFKTLRLRRGLNLKRRHRDHLIRLQELPEVNPYVEDGGGGPDVVEKRACAVVREVLGMATEKRTLVDHLTHFRKEFGLPNRLRGLLVRHPEMFYVSVKGERDSVFLVETYDDKGRLVVEDEMREMKERLGELVREGKRMRRERRRGVVEDDDDEDEDEEEEEEEEEEDDGFGDLFEAGIGEDWEEFGEDWESGDGELVEVGRFWSGKGEEGLEAW